MATGTRDDEVEEETDSRDELLNETDIKRTLEEEFPPSQECRRTCLHDGRLLICDKKVFHCIKTYCKQDKTILGGFGTVYTSENQIPGLHIKVVLKELRCNEDKDSTHLENTAENEKLASRIMHFAIVPLVAQGNDPTDCTIWFLYPRLVKGDLYTLIEADTKRIENDKMEEVELNRNRRLRIMYHVSAAIDFLHTEIGKIRGAVLHLDVKTSNIVLDQFYNARLADFGSAGEASGNETTSITLSARSPHSSGYYEQNFVTPKKSVDCYNFGVVIREMLTGKSSVFKYSEDLIEYLEVMDDSVLEFYIQFQESVWNVGEKMSKVAGTLLELSRKCINNATKRENNEADEEFTSRHIIKEMEGVIRSPFCDGITWKSSTKNGNCEMCMINPEDADDQIPHADSCTSPLKVCVPCMRNSYLNPLRCHSCFREIEPIIGSEYGAVLVAGHYDDEKTFSDSCAKDVADMQNVITSKYPLVIGIRETFVRTITKFDRGASVSSQILSELNSLKQRGVRTILFYYSGHYSNDNGFMLRKGDVQKGDDDNENMPLSEFRDMIKQFSTGDKGKNESDCIIFLDCCEAPILATNQDGIKENIYLKIVQLNACRPNQSAIQEPYGLGSLFKAFFIQALTIKVPINDCILQTEGQNCNICPIDNDDYITIGSLKTYIRRHIELYQERRGRQNSSEPAKYAEKDVKIAYAAKHSANLNFTLTIDVMKKNCSINCKVITNICQLKKELFNEFMAEKMRGDKENENISGVELKAETYKDILRIFIQKKSSDKQKHELCTFEQVMNAWNSASELFVELRNIVFIKNGMVGMFMDGVGELLTFFRKNKHEKEEENNRILYKFDVEVLKDLKMKNKIVQDLRRGLLEIQTEQQQQGAELHVISPCMIDKEGVRHVREDFVCFNIHYKK